MFPPRALFFFAAANGMGLGSRRAKPGSARDSELSGSRRIIGGPAQAGPPPLQACEAGHRRGGHYVRVAALGGFFFSIWSLIATYLVHIVEVKERQQWRDVAQTSLDSLFKAGARGVRNGDRCNACFCSAGRFGEAGIAGTGQSPLSVVEEFRPRVRNHFSGTSPLSPGSGLRGPRLRRRAPPSRGRRSVVGEERDAPRRRDVFHLSVRGYDRVGNRSRTTEPACG